MREWFSAGAWLRLIVTAASLSTATVPAIAMKFTRLDHSTVLASGPIEAGDAARFEALPQFQTLELDSPGGLVVEALSMAANMDARGGIRTVVEPGSSCASACAMALFVSGETRIVFMGGRLGIHSCRTSNDTPFPECNTRMARNAIAHGVPWGIIEGFGNNTRPEDMLWLDAEDSECWGLVKWSVTDSSNDGLACYKWGMLRSEHRPPPAFAAVSADAISCRMNAPTSLIFVPSGNVDQAFSTAYRSACQRIAAEPTTPKYAAVDIILWLTLTDPKVLAMKPGTLVIHIMNNDERQVAYCWKCLSVIGMSMLMHGRLDDAVAELRAAVNDVARENRSAPEWLTSRLALAISEAAKRKH